MPTDPTPGPGERVPDRSGAGAPSADRPEFPTGYGVPPTTDGVLMWQAVESELVAARHYWLASTRPDGRPHVVPRWGVWVDDRFYYDGAPTTRHSRNVERNPAAVLHLESGSRVVIVEGSSYASHADPAGLGLRLSAAFGKYHDQDYRPEADAWAGPDGGGLRVLVPRTALAWFTFPADATRFRFPPRRPPAPDLLGRALGPELPGSSS